MFTLNDNSNKHKVAFYVALVILFITLGQCQSQLVDGTEVISHLSPKNTSTNLSVIRGYDGNKGISEKLTEIRKLFRSLIFDWNLGESGIGNGRTFGRIRMMKNILLPVAFIGGFLTAVIFSIKAIGIVNLFLISSLVALNLAVIVGKLIYAKKIGHGASQTHYHSHFNQQPPVYPSHPPYGSYGSYGSNLGSYSPSYANSRIDDRSPFGRYLNEESESDYPYPTGLVPQSNNPAFQKQKLPNYNQQFINNPSALSGLQQPQQTPTNYRPQNYNNPFSGVHMQSPQQVQQQQPTSNSFNQPLNQLFSKFHDTRFLSNDIVAPVPIFEITTTPSSALDVRMINLQDFKPQSSYSPLEMEKILTNALAQISESKRAVLATALPNVLRFKRKSTNHQPYLNLLRPFS
ncbi:hypothetical protein ACKWTF_004282 [Chironomus riparius]